MPRARRRHGRGEGGRAGHGIEDLDVRAQRPANLTARDDHAAVLEPGRGGIHARREQLSRTADAVRDRVVDDHAVGHTAVGPLAAALISAAGGAAAGGVAGALVGWGIPDEDAKYYEGEVAAGRYLVTVDAGDRAADARSVYTRHGGYDRATAPAM